MNTTGALPRLSIPGDPVLARPVVPTGTIKLDDLALNAMTDFMQATPITVNGDTPIDETLQYMIHAGVRLLFVTGRDSRLIGLITSNDIQGEKPIRRMQAIECMDRTCSRREILVRDIMTPVASWEALDYGVVRRATVAHVVATFKAVGRRHLLVVERPAQSGQCIVRGLFSASWLERGLGLSIDAMCVASSFADIEKALAHPHGEGD
ncbi:MAG: CBS domain-containing protein [Betaproteobacteria bacterium]|nr:CBS domain-containing protein [Betaproteobacteria bacterium]